MTLAAGYDPDFFGPSLGDDAAARIGAVAAGGATSSPGGPISSMLGPPGARTAVDYAYRCGQGATIYRCYAIGKVSNATLVDLQHQINRLGGKHVITEDGILGPATLTAAKFVAASAGILGFQITVPATLDQLAAQAPQLVADWRAAADRKYGPESIAAQTNLLLGAMRSTNATTSHEVAHDKATGQVPAGFSQDSVVASAAAIGQIGARLGAAAAAAAKAADQVGDNAGPLGKSNTKLYIGIGVGLTAVAGLVIFAVAVSGDKKPKRKG